jgi:uncharacterized repeat protein (TIGR01451 family)
VSGAQTASFVGTSNSDLSVSQVATPTGLIPLGQTLTDKVLVSNNGPGPDGNVTLTDTLPAGLSLVSVNTDTGACIGGQTITCNIGALPFSGLATITMVLRTTAPGTTVNTVTVTGSQPDPNPGDNSSSLTITVVASPVPQIDQPLIPASTAPGGAALTLTVHGVGFVPASVVNWNGTARSTTYTSQTQLTASIGESDIATAGTASVTVVNPPPGAGTSNVVFFTVTNATNVVAFNAAAFLAGSGPYTEVTADFNADGKLDLAVVNRNANTVSIMLGNGDGTFQGHVDYPVGSGPDSIVVGDFNGDGKLDLAVSCDVNTNTVSVLLGNGDGTFQSHVDYPVGNLPFSVTTGDFNGDGRLDLAVTNGTDNTVSILLGNGDGTFQNHVDYPVGIFPTSVAVGDFNNDGQLDLVVTNSADGTASVLLGNGDGTFQQHVDSPAGTNPRSVIPTDFNGDGKLDLALFNAGSSNVSVLLGNGDGTFQSPTSYQTGGSPTTVVAGDFNGDGKLDLVTAGGFEGPSPTCSVISVLLGNGDGTFQQRMDSRLPDCSSLMVAGDFNGDGRLDLAVADYSSAVSILLQVPISTPSSSILNFANQDVGTTSAPQTATITNTGSATLTIASVAASGDFAQTNNCVGSLQAGANCMVNVTFIPKATGMRTGTLTITDNSNGVAKTTQTVSLSGTGINPGATVSPLSVSFASQVESTRSAVKKITLTSAGTSNLAIAAIGTTGANLSDFTQTNKCPATLNVGQKCTIAVTFSPSTVGKEVATLGVSDNAATSPQTVALSGIGIAPVVLSPSSASFGNTAQLTSSNPQTFTLTNNQSVAVNISSIATGNSDFRQSNTCGNRLSAHQACAITVRFRPSIIGTETATLTVNDNAANSPQTASLTGNGVAQATVMPTSLTFASQTVGTKSPSSNVTLTNNLNTILTISRVSLTGANPSDFVETNTCGRGLAAKSHCTISVTFTPRATGTRTAALNVFDSANNSPQTVLLSGAGM